MLNRRTYHTFKRTYHTHTHIHTIQIHTHTTGHINIHARMHTYRRTQTRNQDDIPCTRTHMHIYIPNIYTYTCTRTQDVEESLGLAVGHQQRLGARGDLRCEHLAQRLIQLVVCRRGAVARTHNTTHIHTRTHTSTIKHTHTRTNTRMSSLALVHAHKQAGPMPLPQQRCKRTRTEASTQAFSLRGCGVPIGWAPGGMRHTSQGVEEGHKDARLHLSHGQLPRERADLY
jgi:hypothetical protein